MLGRRNLLVVIAGAVLVTVALAAVVVHLPSVQRGVWRRLAASIEAETGWRISADEIALRGMPARLRARGVIIGTGRGTVATLDCLEARWRWRSITGTPHRMEFVSLENLEIDVSALPPSEDGDGAPEESFWNFLEIVELRLIGGSGNDTVSGVEVAVDGVTVDGRLASGSASAEISAARITLKREGRTLDLGGLALEGYGSEEGLQIDRLELESSAIGVRVGGKLRTKPTAAGRFDLGVMADMEKISAWWDPNLVTGLEPSGILRFDGYVAMTAEHGFEMELVHQGHPVRVGGYDLEEIGLMFKGGQPTVRLSHPGWGRATIAMAQPGVASISAVLDRAPIDRLLAFTAPRVAGLVGGPAVVSGEINGTASFPIVPELLAGQVDIVVESPEGQIAIRGEGAGTTWRLDDFEARALGAELRASGTIDEDTGIAVAAQVNAHEPSRVVESLGRWMPSLREVPIGGGPLEARLRIDGPLDRPGVRANAIWSEPVLAGRRFEDISFNGSGTVDDLEWDLGLMVTPETSVTASGTARPFAGEAEGVWVLEVSDIAELASAQGLVTALPVSGRFTGEGSFGVSAGDVRIAGAVEAEAVGAGDWAIDRLRAEFETRGDTLEVRAIEMELYEGVIQGSLVVPLTDLDHHFRSDLRWRGLDLTAMPIELPEHIAGTIAGELGFGGRMTQPQGDLDLEWQPAGSPSLVDGVLLHAALAEGMLRIATERVETAGGPLFAEAVLPLGGFQRPEWLWPEAPAGAVRATIDAPGFRSGPLADAIGVEGLPVAAEADLRAEVEWDPEGAQRPRVLVEASGLRLLYASGELVAEGPLIAMFDGGRLELAPVVLVGRGSRVEASAVYDPDTVLVTGRVRARLASDLSRLLPLPLNVTGPLTVEADLVAPADASMSLESVRGRLTIDHRDGTMVMRDPPVEIRGLQVVATIRDGVLSIEEGQAEVNRGQVQMGGGWDPRSGQGLVLELEGVTALMAGILTKWDGSVAVEPHPDRLAQVVGELNLVAGLWDERFDVAGAVLGGGGTEIASDDPLHDVGLDLTVRGRAGIRVENNLGRFNVNWDVLRIGGTAAEPSLRGEVRIAPGGVLTLAGQEVRVRRGSLEFAGDPATDTVMAIVPETDTTLVGSGDGKSFDAAALATEGLARGITSALGFENETLRPAEIAVQTEKDPSVRFMVGQRLNRNLALFLATNLTDVQDRMTMLQYWNLPRFKGLAVQAYQETADDSLGANLFQRFEWGGTVASDGRPEIHRLRLEGDWPMSRRTLRRATRLRRGQPYDGFLLFVGAVRMERLLAERGYQNARVTGNQEGPPSSPTLVFTCDPGIQRRVDFRGDDLPKQIRNEVTALYQHPPLEDTALENMRSMVERYFAGEGYLQANVVVERRDDLVVVDVVRGEKVEILGPFYAGAPVDGISALLGELGTTAALATAAARPDWAARIVERTLKNAGYLQARVLDVSLEFIDSKKAEIHISVDAGPLEKVGSVVLIGSDPLGLITKGGFGVIPGEALDREVIDSAIRDLRDAYIVAGYRETSVHSVLRQDDQGGWVVEIRLVPNQQRVVREIRFAGRRDVSERVLRKGVTIEPGEVLTDSGIDRSASRIANFSPVERVEVRAVPVPGSQADVEFDVVEKRRWKVEAGGGWSTERGLGAAFGLRDENLFGRGVGLNLRGSWDATETRFFLIGSVPPVPGGRVSFISTIGYSTGDDPTDPDFLNRDQKLASLEASYRLPKNVQAGVYYRWTDTRTYEKVPDDFFPFDSTLRIGTLGVRTVVDRFDYLFDPRRGWGLTSDLGWSGEEIGSDLDYASWLSGFSLALEPFRGSTWMQAVRIGVAEPFRGSNLDSEARFFAGGQSSIRGFDLNSVGPVTYGFDGLVPVGGGALFVLNEELRIPIWDPLRLAVFTDVGQVWESWRDADLKFSVGVGIGLRWSTPIGPLWADIAWPVVNVGISSTKPKFYLGIGRPF